ncbi:MAG: ion transporter [Terriglobia bacterium]
MPSQVFDGSIILLIGLTVLAVIIETVPEYSCEYRTFLRDFETLSVLIFSVEYLTRLWTCSGDQRFSRPVVAEYGITPLALVDLAAVLPFYLPLSVRVDLRMLQMLRFLVTSVAQDA